jgi:nicotinamidase-related amidase
LARCSPGFWLSTVLRRGNCPSLSIWSSSRSLWSPLVVNNVIGLAKAAKIFNVPTILTTVVEDRGGKLIKGLQDIFPDQKPIDRTSINTWEDARVVEAVKKPQEAHHGGTVDGNLPRYAGDPGGR